jgi:CBS domain-containing protein
VLDLDLPMREVMTHDVVTVGPEAPLTDALTAMINGGFHHLPVVDRGDLVGIVSMGDLLSALRDQDPALRDLGVVLADDRRVRHVLSPAPATLSIDAELRDAVRMFADHGWHAVPVVAGLRLVGIFTTRDLARRVLQGR